MSDWLLNLPVLWMAVVVFAAIYLLAATTYWVVTRLAVNDRARAFKAVSPGMLPPLGILFALLVGFIAVEVWNFESKGSGCVRGRRIACCRSRRKFPEEQKRFDALVDRHIDEARIENGRAMATHSEASRREQTLIEMTC